MNQSDFEHKLFDRYSELNFEHKLYDRYSAWLKDALMEPEI